MRLRAVPERRLVVYDRRDIDRLSSLFPQSQIVHKPASLLLLRPPSLFSPHLTSLSLKRNGSSHRRRWRSCWSLSRSHTPRERRECPPPRQAAVSSLSFVLVVVITHYSLVSWLSVERGASCMADARLCVRRTSIPGGHSPLRMSFIRFLLFERLRSTFLFACS